MNLLEVSHLRKTFGHFVAVEDVSFYRGRRRGVRPAGPQRAGKSTTMNMIVGPAGPRLPASILLDGQELDPENRELRMAMGVVPQDLAIYPDLTARENLRLFRPPLRNSGTRTQVARSPTPSSGRGSLPVPTIGPATFPAE